MKDRCYCSLEAVCLDCLADLTDTRTPCRGKNIPDIFDCNLKKDYQISIIFDSNISNTTGNQMTCLIFHRTYCLFLHYLGKQNERNIALLSYFAC